MRTILLLVVILSIMSCEKDVLTEDNLKADSNDTLNIKIRWESLNYTDSLKISHSQYYEDDVDTTALRKIGLINEYGLCPFNMPTGIVPGLGKAAFEFQTNKDFILRIEKIKNLKSKIKVSIYIHYGNPAKLEGDSLVYQTTLSINPIVIKGKFSNVDFHVIN